MNLPININIDYEYFKHFVPTYLQNSKQYYVCITNLAGKYVFVNQLFQERYSFITENFLGLDFAITIHYEDINKCNEAALYCISHPNKTTIVKIRKPQENLADFYWTEWEFSLLKDENQQAIGILCVGNDDTEKENLKVKEKENYERLVYSESKLRAIIDCSPNYKYLISSDFAILSINKSAKKLIKSIFGKEPAEGHDFRQYLIKGTEENFFKNFYQALAGKTVLVEEEFALQEGVPKSYFQIAYVPAYHKQGKLLGITLTFTSINKRKQIEESLSDAQNKLKAILDSSPVIYILLSPDLKVLSTNQTARKSYLTLMNREVKEGDDFRGFILKETEESFFQNFNRALAGEQVTVEREIYLKEKFKKWFEFAFFPAYDQQGRLIGVSFSALDIDSRKRTEQQLRYSESKVQGILDSRFSSIALIGRSFEMLSINKKMKEAANKLFGKEPQEGDNCLEYVMPDAQDSFKANIEKAFTGEKVFVEKELLEVGGKKYWLDVTYSPVFDDSHQIIGVAYNAIDITHRKKVEDELLESERRLAILANNFPDGSISLIDKNLQILYTGGKIYQTLGINPLTLIGQSISSIFPADTSCKIIELLPSILAGNLHHFEVTRENKVYMNTLSPIIDEPKDIIDKFVLSIIDITAQKQREEEIRSKNEKLEKIAWIQSHEIRRPVANILGLVNLMNEESSYEGIEIYLEHLYRATKELDMIIHKIVYHSNDL